MTLQTTASLLLILLAATPAWAAGEKSVNTLNHPPAHAIPYHGGPVLHAPVETHLFWGGYWTTRRGLHDRELLNAFAEHIGGTDWFQLLTVEYQDHHAESRGDSLAGPVDVDSDADSEPGPTVTDAEIRAEVRSRIENGNLRFRDQAVYVVFTPPRTEVTAPHEGRSCQKLCAWHDHFKAKGPGGTIRDIKYAVIPYLNCPASCGVPGLHVNTPSLDQITLSLSHELAEAVSDPDLNAWMASGGEGEIGDLCDGGFSVTSGRHAWAVQELWSNASLRCVRGATAP